MTYCICYGTAYWCSTRRGKEFSDSAKKTNPSQASPTESSRLGGYQGEQFPPCVINHHSWSYVSCIKWILMGCLSFFVVSLLAVQLVVVPPLHVKPTVILGVLCRGNGFNSRAAAIRTPGRWHRSLDRFGVRGTRY